MGNANDDKILKLKEVIEKKKAGIEKVVFSPKTNCSIELDGDRYNLHAMNKEGLTFLLIRINAYRMSMNNLGIEDLVISGYSIQDWIEDIKIKIATKSQVEEEKQLKALENKLSKLLSEDKQTEMELSSIEALLNS